MLDLNENEIEWLNRLKSSEYGQAHLVESTAHNATSLKSLLKQIQALDASYPGGMLQYLGQARKLLSDSRDGVDAFHGMRPSIPRGVVVELASTQHLEYERIGLQELGKICFVLVAGGLGERLGFPRIKISLPVESTTLTSYINHYVDYILAYEDYVEECTGKRTKLPLVIMTSDDTDESTRSMLEEHNYFGLSVGQISIVKQQKVPALLDFEARIATVPGMPHVIDTKPHGHGDVHILLNQHGFTKKWEDEGREWIFFFQDTNALAFNALPTLLGVAKKHELAMNSLAIPRKPGEAVGCICELQKQDGSSVTINVEYNQLEALLRTNGMKCDEADPNTGNSIFPGNCNNLLFRLETYSKTLQTSGGIVPEFVNPKYKDSSATAFKTPTRVECMMQDFARLFSSEDKVGFTQMPRWVCFSPVKNNASDALLKSKLGLPPESAFSGESDQYYANAKLLELAAKQKSCEVNIAGPQPKAFGNILYRMGPRLVLHPSFAFSLTHLQDRIAFASHLKISVRSTLVLRGKVEINGLDLDGALTASASPGKCLNIKNLLVRNNGWPLEALEDPSNEEVPLVARVRGFQIMKNDDTTVVSSN